MNKCTLVLADDHPVIRDGLKLLINAQPDMAVIGEASNGVEALEKIKELNPDMAVLDISMPRCSGVEVTQQIKKQFPRTRVVVLTVHEDLDHMRLLMEAGAMGYVLKRSVSENLIKAVRAVTKGERYLDPAAGEVVANNFAQSSVLLEGKKLSKREGDILRCVVWGKINKQIGAELGISAKTVETYRLRAMRKLGLKTREGLVQYAARRGWLRIRETPDAARL